MKYQCLVLVFLICNVHTLVSMDNEKVVQAHDNAEQIYRLIRKQKTKTPGAIAKEVLKDIRSRVYIRNKNLNNQESQKSLSKL